MAAKSGKTGSKGSSGKTPGGQASGASKSGGTKAGKAQSSKAEASKAATKSAAGGGDKRGGGAAHDLRSAREALRSGAVTAAALLERHLSSIDAAKGLNAYVRTTADLAAAQASESDKRLAAGNPRPLEGLPVSIKDNFCVAGVETTACSRILEGFTPAYDATVIARLRDAGAVFLGKTNMDEFGMGSSTETSVYGPTLNPLGTRQGRSDVVPGGSSGGAAAAVAADLCLAAMATDTGGSIRQPASFSGAVGYKPSYGLCSRWGIIAYASSLDQAGVICKSVADAAIMADVIVGEDARDSTSIKWTGGSFEAAIAKPKKGLRVGLPREFREIVQSPVLSDVWKRTEAAIRAGGGEVVDVSLPNVRYALPAYYIVALSEASSNLARYDGVRYGRRAKHFSDLVDMYETTRGEGFGREVKKRIMLGTFCLSAGYYDQYYSKALKVRRLIYEDFRAAFGKADILAWPTTPTAAFAIGAHASDPLTMYLEDVFTVPVNLAGLPAISIPVLETAEKLPMGLTLAAPHRDDAALLTAAAALEATLAA